MEGVVRPVDRRADASQAILNGLHPSQSEPEGKPQRAECIRSWVVTGQGARYVCMRRIVLEDRKCMKRSRPRQTWVASRLPLGPRNTQTWTNQISLRRNR